MNKARNGDLKTAARLGGIWKKKKIIHQIEFLRQSWFRAREVTPLSILQSWRPNIKASSGAHNWLDIYVGLQLRACTQPHLPGALRTREPETGNTSLWTQPVLQREGEDQPQQPDQCRQAPPAPKHPTPRDSQGQVQDAATLSNYCYKNQTTPKHKLLNPFLLFKRINNSPAIPDYETYSKYTNSSFQINRSEAPWEQVLGFKRINCTSSGFSLGHEAADRIIQAFH